MRQDDILKKILGTLAIDEVKNDERYTPRIVEVKRYKKILKDGNEVERIKYKRMFSPLPPSYIMKAMNMHPVGGFEASHKKNPRFVNCSPTFKKRHGKWIWVRAILKRTLNKVAIALIKEGQKKVLFNSFGFILPEYKKTIRVPVPNKHYYKHAGYQLGYQYKAIPKGFKEIGRKIVVINED